MADKAFDNYKHNGIRLTFSNGNWISTIWGYGSYSDGRDVSYKEFTDSDNCEVMFHCGDKLNRRLHKKFDGDGSVIGCVSVDDWLYIVSAISKELSDE